MTESISRDELEAEHCWEAEDRVPRGPEMTAFRQRLRLHQSRWREANGHPIGTQPIVPRPGAPWRPVGSRLPLDYARDTGASFLTPTALAAIRSRLSIIEPHQSVDHQRVWADLLWAPAMAFNLFGDLAADLRLNSLRSFDAAFVLDLDDGTQGVIGVAVKYHERNKRETPRPGNMSRYRAVLERSGIFTPDAIDAVNPSDLAVMWLEHLLVLSMVQHPSGMWSWGRYAVVHPEGNVDVVDALSRYRTLLVDDSTFSSMTLESLLDADVLPEPTMTALRKRYLPM